jgi:hypothetical protein
VRQTGWPGQAWKTFLMLVATTAPPQQAQGALQQGHQRIALLRHAHHRDRPRHPPVTHALQQQQAANSRRRSSPAAGPAVACLMQAQRLLLTPVVAATTARRSLPAAQTVFCPATSRQVGSRQPGARSCALQHAKRTTSPAGLMRMRLLQALSALHSQARHRNQVCCKLSILSRRALCSTYNGSKLCSNYWMLSREAACCGRHVLGVSIVRCLWCRLVDLGHGLVGSKRGWPEPDAPAWLEPSDQTSSAMDPGAQRVVKVKAHKLAATSHPRPWILAPKRRC